MISSKTCSIQKTRLYVNIIQSAIFFTPQWQLWNEIPITFFQLGCILRNPKRMKQTRILQCMHDKHFASRIPAIWLQNVLDLHSAYLIVIIMFPINKLKYISYDSKGAKYHFKVSLFAFSLAKKYSVINLEKKKNPKGK